MRAVFLILLVANLLFLAWAQWIDGPRDAGAHDASSNLPRLQLMEEKGPPKPSGSNSPQPVLTPPLPPEAQKVSRQMPILPAVPRCTSIGPFKDIAHAARAAGLLAQRGFKLEQRAEEGETIKGYWVFVGGLTSEKEVEEVVARLEKNGFTDAHVMKNSYTNRRISVGMFSTRDRAEKRAAAIEAMGLSPEVGERKFPGTLYWIDVALASADDEPPPMYLFADIGNTRVQMLPCAVTLTPGHTPASLAERTTIASAPRSTQLQH